ncbi:DUF3923 family protein [Natribacillus halophilus]|uniref:DUF3923 family protein n=1 Tax=Natribacillus halophilus TaxID=549003 RepID=A0A1G8SUW6_9BACI|nr:DUF3923 family protein [Natribacillus halophilus]SDJ32555.1 Protein of unknown function [Natribacillus halophilus]
MKFAWIAWWIVNAFWLALFASGSILLAQRDVDATGAVQTPGIIMLNILVLAMLFIIPLLIQIGWLVVMLVVKNKRNKEMTVQE